MLSRKNIEVFQMKENSQQLQQDIKHDRQMIEASFDSNKLLTPKEMKERFGKFGWGKHED